MNTSVFWFRRDLRLTDHPALNAAARHGRVLPVFVLDPRLIRPRPQLDRLHASLAALRDQTGGALVIRQGDPTTVVPELAREVNATAVHVTAETTPFGRRRDVAVQRRLAAIGIGLIDTESPYAVTPGRIHTSAGTPYQVFTPFRRAWQEHSWSSPAPTRHVSWCSGGKSDVECAPTSIPAGEKVAQERWEEFRDHDLAGYASWRDRPDLNRTSRLSIALKYGEIHPRTLLADIRNRDEHRHSPGAERFVTELAWREFHADVLWHAPYSAWSDLRNGTRGMRYDHDPAMLSAWRTGTTGFPFVDAGMRQLLAEGWMHNRVRMVAASFLIKDLHVWWPVGARHFLDHLLDADVASNNHGWQWIAGTGTDSAPYFRVFNPVRQGLRFDPNGDYIRRWIPELRHLPGAAAHQPWNHPDGLVHRYPQPVVDHADERREALARLAYAKENSR